MLEENLECNFDLLTDGNGQIISLHEDSQWLIHELAGNLKGLRRHGSREKTPT